MDDGHYSVCYEGRWIPTQTVFPQTCSVIGLQHVKTFDGKEYDIRGPVSNVTLVEVRQFRSLVKF